MKVTVAGKVLQARKTSDFGAIESIRDNKPHTGVDYSFAEGTPLTAVQDGVVERIADFGSQNAGKTLYLRLDDGNTAIYGHLSEFKVNVGERVNAGETVALSGNTGHSSGAHLHFGVKAPNGEFIDPAQYEPMIASMGASTNWITQKYNEVSDYIVGKEVEWILAPIGKALSDMMTGTIEAIYLMLPEIGAFVTVITGVLMMITGKPGKWVGMWALLMGVIVAWKIGGV
ncbi:MAG: M23 family metallopeptidase [Bacillota bacterium]